MNATVPINQDKKRKGLIGTVRTVASKTPKNMIPKVRRPQFAFSEANDMPRYWWDNDPAKTLLLAALSASFPPAGAFFH
ncbi:hypothetical protein [Alcanivorax sp.]|uniref:hypothetical protein n=1 Tax=Alcanivorax sp. TaxID=1872427 RepID=UPI003BAAE305